MAKQLPQTQFRMGPERQALFDGRLAELGIDEADALRDAVDLWLGDGPAAVSREPAKPQRKSTRPVRSMLDVMAPPCVATMPPRHVDVQLGPSRQAYGARLKG